MNEQEFPQGSVPVAVAARVYGKDASWVRAGIVSGWLPIGKATRSGKLVTTIEEMDSRYGRINFYISPKRLYDVRCFGYDPYNAKEFVERWAAENGPFGIEKVIQGAKTESVPLGELKKLAEDRMLLFDEELMTYAMGNCIAMEDTNGNRKLMKKRYEQKIDAVSAMMDAYIAYKRNPEAFE